jgi:hypothetical protein
MVPEIPPTSQALDFAGPGPGQIEYTGSVTTAVMYVSKSTVREVEMDATRYAQFTGNLHDNKNE